MKSKPFGDVVVDITSSDTGEFVVSPAQLTFTPANWNVDQTITVTGIPDDIIDGNQDLQLVTTVNQGLTFDAV